jgi:hypothetical protein
MIIETRFSFEAGFSFLAGTKGQTKMKNDFITVIAATHHSLFIVHLSASLFTFIQHSLNHP